MQWWFPYDNNDKKIIALLKQASPDFQFDQENVKAKLFMRLGADVPGIERYHADEHHYMPKFAAGLIASLLLVATTAGVTFASNKAKPGERLFLVQQLQNNLVLSLPLPDDQKAQIRTDIVAQRFLELDQIESPKLNPIRVSAEIKTSQESIDDAVSNLATIQNQAHKNHAKILAIIKQLDELSTKHQQKMESIRKDSTDDKINLEIDKSLESIKINQEKLRKAQAEQAD